MLMQGRSKFSKIHIPQTRPGYLIAVSSNQGKYGDFNNSQLVQSSLAPPSHDTNYTHIGELGVHPFPS